MSILDEIVKSSPSNIIDLYEADFTSIPTFINDDSIIPGGKLYFFSDTNELGASLVFNGIEYSSVPCELTGIEWSGSGQLPTPKFRVANINGALSALNGLYEDLLWLKITRIRTMLKYIDAVNFTSGTNATADPTAQYPIEVYYIDRKAVENNSYVEYDLVSALDISSVKLPRRLVIQNLCSWRYKDANCGYIPSEYDNRMFTEMGEPTTNPVLDNCGHKLSDCKKRFGTKGVLNYGGFPGAGLYS